MCKFKSGIILKDGVFMPDYNSHTQMLKELKIEDSQRNAKSKFVRAEIYPKNGDVFTNMNTWVYHVDQDITPDWYVSEYDEQRVRDALNEWSNKRRNKYANKKQLSDLDVGDRFIIGIIEYIVLDKTNNGISCLAVDFVNNSKMFDENDNNFATSSINSYLNTTYFNWLAENVGAENIVEHSVRLNNSNGSKCHGDYNTKISLLTLEQYNKYRSVIPNASGWWLSTPYAGYSCGVCYVRSNRDVNYGFCFYDLGVRSFCIFKSSIFVSCK